MPTNKISIEYCKKTGQGNCKMDLTHISANNLKDGLNELFEIEILQGIYKIQGDRVIIEFESTDEKLLVLEKAFAYEIFLANRNLN